MADNSETGKDKARPGDAGQPKKPYATLDLKATEVASSSNSTPPAPASAKPEAAKTDPGKVGASRWPDADKTKDAAPVGTAPAGTAPASASAPSASVPGVGKPVEPPKTKVETGKLDDGKPAATAYPAGSAPQPPPRRSGGFGRFLSHLAAGIVGGFITLLGGEQLAQTFGLSELEPSSALLQKRVAALESQGRGPGAPVGDVARKVAEGEARLGRLEDMTRAFPQLLEASGRLANETKSLQERIGQGGGNGEAAQRIAKLEETLATLSAAGQNANAGPLPQLVAMTARIRELEATIGTQTTSLRRELTQSLETRTQQATEVGEVARAATQRIDRDLSAVKTESATLTQRVEALKSDTDRNAQTLRVVQEETGSVRSALDGLKGDLDSRLKSVARPTDVTAALAPVTSKLTELEQGLQGVVKSEADRRSSAERIVLSLELANLKRVLDRGQRYDVELAEVKKAAGGRIDLAALERHKSEGVLTLLDLSGGFRGAVKAILDAEGEPADGNVMDRLLAGAKSIVRVRKIEHGAGDKSAEAIVARMESSLKDGRLGQVLDEAKSLSPRAQDAARDWLAKVEARHSVDRALAAVEGQLKSSLGAGKTQN